jgi:uncharacterized protein (TIGR02646 family)
LHELVRAEAPSCLTEQAPGWTEAFVLARVKGAARFRWPSDPCYQAVRATLLTMSAHHCAFCDGLLGQTSRETVEHFRPKATFPELAYDWGNLYPCCDGCQTKGTLFEAALLQPDGPGYRFEHFSRDPDPRLDDYPYRFALRDVLPAPLPAPPPTAGTPRNSPPPASAGAAPPG